MERYTPTLLLIVLLITLHCCSPTLKVTNDYDKNADFSQYKTFAIDTFRVSETISGLNIDRISGAVRNAMMQKGFTESTSPDMLVHLAAIVKDKKSVSSTTNYYGYGGYYRPYAWGGGVGVSGSTTYNVADYKDGSLIIDIADAKTKHLLWEGLGNQEIDKPAKDPDAAITAAVNKIMANFPPGAINK